MASGFGPGVVGRVTAAAREILAAGIATGWSTLFGPLIAWANVVPARSNATTACRSMLIVFDLQWIRLHITGLPDSTQTDEYGNQSGSYLRLLRCIDLLREAAKVSGEGRCIQAPDACGAPPADT